MGAVKPMPEAPRADDPAMGLISALGEDPAGARAWLVECRTVIAENAATAETARAALAEAADRIAAAEAAEAQAAERGRLAQVAEAAATQAKSDALAAQAALLARRDEVEAAQVARENGLAAIEARLRSLKQALVAF